jgi:hypothetical protein
MKAKNIPLAALLIVIVFSMIGCSESEGPPYPVKDIQIGGSYLSEGYDVYKNVAFHDNYKAGISPDKVNALLDYYMEKFKDQKRVKVMIFRDAAAAVQGVTNLIVGELEMVDGEVIFRRVNIS